MGLSPRLCIENKKRHYSSTTIALGAGESDGEKVSVPFIILVQLSLQVRHQVDRVVTPTQALEIPIRVDAATNRKRYDKYDDQGTDKIKMKRRHRRRWSAILNYHSLPLSPGALQSQRKAPHAELINVGLQVFHHESKKSIRGLF